jgi:hypothetical protein
MAPATDRRVLGYLWITMPPPPIAVPSLFGGNVRVHDPAHAPCALVRGRVQMVDVLPLVQQLRRLLMKMNGVNRQPCLRERPAAPDRRVEAEHRLQQQQQRGLLKLRRRHLACGVVQRQRQA